MSINQTDQSDWHWLVKLIDYHNKQWFVCNYYEWVLSDRKGVLAKLQEYGVANPEKVIRQFYYRDQEAHARAKRQALQPMLPF